jgi:hypothetical protein
MIFAIAGAEDTFDALSKQIMNDWCSEVYITEDDYLLHLHSREFLEHLTIFGYY